LMCSSILFPIISGLQMAKGNTFFTNTKHCHEM
jgi:hypothetical protein